MLMGDFMFLDSSWVDGYPSQCHPVFPKMAVDTLTLQEYEIVERFVCWVETGYGVSFLDWHFWDHLIGTVFNASLCYVSRLGWPSVWAVWFPGHEGS